MTIRAVVFDIGGVLEITPSLGVDEAWEQKLGLKSGELNQNLTSVWKGGSLGTMTEAEVHQNIGAIVGMSSADVDAYMADVWTEYLGTLNVELYDYFKSLRPRCKTAIISNSFVGARQKEQAHYGFEDSCDLIVYSHEVGLRKPDPAIFALACELLAIQPAEMIFVDDVDVLITAARELGIQGVHFRDNTQTIAEIEALLAE